MKRTALAAFVLLLSTPPARAAPPLVAVADMPLPGGPTRFDYQSFDATNHLLYVSHMGDGELLAIDTRARRVTGRLTGLPRITGVLAVPGRHRLYASVPDLHAVAVVDLTTFRLLASVPAGNFPDGLAFAPEASAVFVSDEHGSEEVVVDARTNRRLGAIPIGGGAGNTQYDAGSRRIFVTVQTRNELVEIDPVQRAVVARHALAGGESPHGLLIVAPQRLAFAACEDDARLLAVDLETFAVRQNLPTGDDPDVLAFDPGRGSLYVACESGVVSIFQLRARALTKVEDLAVAPNAHTVAVDPDTHEVFLPLPNVDGHPVLRILRPRRSEESSP